MSSTTPLEYRDAFVARVRQAGSMRTILNVPLQRSAAWTQVLTATMSVDEAKSRRRGTVDLRSTHRTQYSQSRLCFLSLLLLLLSFALLGPVDDIKYHRQGL